MGKRCKEGEQRDILTRSCVPCRMLCQQLPASPSCAIYCEPVFCKAKPGHYYDRLVRRCMKCADICGKHPAECSPHCPTQSPLTTTKRLPSEVSKQAVNTKPPLGPLDPAIQLYALLGLCTILLLSSLCLALVVLLRRGKAKNSNTKPTSTKNQKQTSAVQPGQESGFPESKTGGSLKGWCGKSPTDLIGVVTFAGILFLSILDCPASSTHPPCRESSEDSYPTETCMCVHCFPDLRGLSQDSSRQQRPSDSFYQQGILHRAHIQNGGSLWTGGSLSASGPKVQQEAAVG
ncbi:tumor necrosis factor receptor superfamily member 13B isoform X1 [Gambusia affinis]|uniref:tumor necrosis factor receptor superfamily member 13B isoform X1 n=1 Tax=Gambusia affinis TaxID=33528 RepID=UPI001CDC1EAA|nr:tumor necrosis factor receptor superfamily member 13B isoform X1 [Gambusia affinis]XP_043959632.1 tumor necrosis factor receptor superfamily member 13B isoform X1 [Gambusia affinis]